jgi:hypothetical protein
MKLSMLVQGFLRDIKSAYGDWLPGLRFLIMFIGMMVGPLVLLVVGVRDLGTLSETGLAWSFMAIALLLLTGLGVGFSMFMRGARFPSIGPRRI